jgi:hypothetical protein
LPSHAQVTATPNGIADNRAGAYAFTNAMLYQSDGSYVNGSLLIRDGQIVSVQAITRCRRASSKSTSLDVIFTLV